MFSIRLSIIKSGQRSFECLGRLPFSTGMPEEGTATWSRSLEMNANQSQIQVEAMREKK
jgi:hypothetical protein